MQAPNNRFYEWLIRMIIKQGLKSINIERGVNPDIRMKRMKGFLDYGIIEEV